MAENIEFAGDFKLDNIVIHNHDDTHSLADKDATLTIPTETTIILAVIGMLGLFATATVYQRSNRITSRYYSNK